MNFNLKETDFVVCFWYAEDANEANFLMLLRRQPLCWQLDWRFRYPTHVRYYSAVNGLQTPEADVIEIGRGAHARTGVRFPLRRIFQHVNGPLESFRVMLIGHNLHTKGDLV